MLCLFLLACLQDHVTCFYAVCCVLCAVCCVLCPVAVCCVLCGVVWGWCVVRFMRGIVVGVCASQGPRSRMEDSHLALSAPHYAAAIDQVLSVGKVVRRILQLMVRLRAWAWACAGPTSPPPTPTPLPSSSPPPPLVALIRM